MTKLYRVPCILYSTAYIRADSADHALELYNAHIRDRWVDEEIEVNHQPGPYADMPDISLSSSLTAGDAEADEIEMVSEEADAE